jgi:hypothetical protein
MASPRRRTLRVLALVCLLGVEVGVNVAHSAGVPWPKWMDQRWGWPLSWSMFSESISFSAEVRANVAFDDGTEMLVGHGQSPWGPGEWAWTSADAWHVYAWWQSGRESLAWDQVATYARDATGRNEPANVRFSVIERTSRDDGTVEVVERPVGPPDGVHVPGKAPT